MRKRGERHWEVEASLITPLPLDLEEPSEYDGTSLTSEAVSTFEIHTENIGDRRITSFLELLEHLSGAFATAKRADAHWTLITVYSENEERNCSSVAGAATFYRLQWKQTH